MATENISNVKLGSNSRTILLTSALLLSLGSMVAVFWYVGVQTGYDNEYVSYSSEQQVLSQKLAKTALEASAGVQTAAEKTFCSKKSF